MQRNHKRPIPTVSDCHPDREVFLEPKRSDEGSETERALRQYKDIERKLL